MVKNPYRPLKKKFLVKAASFFNNLTSDIPYRIVVDNGDWTPDFGTSVEERQKFGPYDSDDCWQFSPNKGLEMQFNALYKRGEFSPEAVQFFQSNGYMDANGYFNFSDQFFDIVSGNLNNGGEAEEFYQLVQQYGVVPHFMLYSTDAIAAQYPTLEAFDAYYYSPSLITPAMLALGQQSLKYFNLEYQRVGKLFQTPDNTTLSTCIKQSPLALGVPVNYQWNQVNVPALKSGALNHEVTLYKTDQSTVGYPIVDNYIPYLKVLGAGYSINSVVQGVVTGDKTVIQSPVSVWDKVWSAVHDYLVSLNVLSTGV